MAQLFSRSRSRSVFSPVFGASGRCDGFDRGSRGMSDVGCRMSDVGGSGSGRTSACRHR